MHEIRLAGRGGSGVVTAGELLGRAAVREGRCAQAMPSFGPERRGALAQCSLRLAEDEILLKCSFMQPDVLCVIDATIWHHFNVTLGLKEGGTLVFNSTDSPDEIRDALREARYGYAPPIERMTVYAVDATGIALETIGKAIANTAMMGALAGATGLLKMESIEDVLAERFGDRADGNVAAARAGHDRIQGVGD
jgi:2-oxoacid:acceptor oxidoreductase gamma subunit (pyruvate/2-ketoisovalerate family)